jgi:septum formation protein
MSIVLASASPRRADLLRAAGLEFIIAPVDVDERRLPDEPAGAYVARVAALKADAALARQPDRTILAADTAVVVDGDVFGKPADASEAARMLRRLSGRAHQVLTGVVVAGGGRRVAFVDEATVWLTPLSEDAIAWYVASGEPLDKAGGYAVQGLASRFVARIDGSYATVVGLPVARVAAALDQLG